MSNKTNLSKIVEFWTEPLFNAERWELALAYHLTVFIGCLLIYGVLMMGSSHFEMLTGIASPNAKYENLVMPISIGLLFCLGWRYR